MKISDLFQMGIKSLFRRKTRTILTTLGVVIGTLCIIITIAIGNGVKDSYNKLVMSQGGLTTINITSNGASQDANGNWISSSQKLDDNLVNKIKSIEHVKAVTPIINPNGAIWCGKYRSWTQLVVMDMSTYKDFTFPDLQYGQYPTKEDDTYIIFGSQASSQFSDPNSMNWQPVKVDIQKKKLLLKFDQAFGPMTTPTDPDKEYSLPLKNVGMMVESKGMYDYNVYMDINYFRKEYRRYCNTLSVADRRKAMKTIQSYSQIQLNTDNINQIEEVQKKIQDMGYQSYSDIQYLQPLKKASKNIQLILFVMGVIVMLASAISIANTMVMSIYERTKEIGIMKVLGCTISDIRKLFLFEAANIGLFGGLIGIAFGYIASWAINRFGAPIFSSLMSGNYTGDMTDTKFSIIPIYLPLISLAISIGVGLLSGYFPARRATKIKAIEAMKTEG